MLLALGIRFTLRPPISSVISNENINLHMPERTRNFIVIMRLAEYVARMGTQEMRVQFWLGNLKGENNL
jgi:hypothetical protein